MGRSTDRDLQSDALTWRAIPRRGRRGATLRDLPLRHHEDARALEKLESRGDRAGHPWSEKDVWREAPTRHVDDLNWKRRRAVGGDRCRVRATFRLALPARAARRDEARDP